MKGFKTMAPIILGLILVLALGSIALAGTGKPAANANCIAVDAKAKFGAIEGYVTFDSANTPVCVIANAHIRLLDKDGKVVNAAQSDKKGYYFFKHIKPLKAGEFYTISVWAKGYKSAKITGVVVEKGKTKRYDVKLVKDTK